ncbi:RagB/SusD family nutrient uptake outer membrane protein [Sphingobacterium sp. UT-1RO-CII-1]|uniref:RagB/SusD family nutrient uptake outer membrane protein n=1 Tax=Sphingobacterium sp. UT-1RO-CII-1 TaxID=2995225 RepID=UPI00227D6FFF|nr:RagB/SusD family nutrient uptake outer membrane protein [Sphingobacterium sp. UT-1RO-CII-1]MCY4778362.1 RagB/SusD family nutrient uptake outer membrane protein [Sphingobacterium sp. UT-1RO-CII-1]
MRLIYILALGGALAFSACNHMLDVKPHSFSSDNNYYENEEQMLRAVNGVYGRLQGLYTSDFWALTEMRADNTTYQYAEADRGAQQREEIDEFLITASNNYVNNAWSNMYNTIQQANVVLTRIEGVQFADEALKNRYIAEVKFIRATQYFHLVRLFGEVPFHVTEITEPTATFTYKKASIDEVYDLIITDVTFAAQTLPGTEGYGKNDVGRVTKGAAYTLLGEVHLTRKEYSLAVKAFQEVTKLGYTLVNDYADCFSPLAKNNKESIFEVQYDHSIEGENSNFIFMFGPRDAKMDLVGFPGTLGSTNIPTLSIYNAYETDDLRRDKSIALYDHESSKNYQEAQAFGYKMPFIKKFYHAPYLEDGRSNENWPVYRYAHVLLMLAESLQESGEGDPYPHLNAVRQRAGLKPLSGLSKEDLTKAIAHEQRVEVAFENHRWYQLLRTGTAEEVMKKHGVEEKKRLSRLSEASYNIQKHKLLFPIPEREVRLNGISQNQGW